MPSVVVVLVDTVRVEENVGFPEDGLNEHVEAGGQPEQLKDTVWVVPLVNVTVIVYVVESPAVTVLEEGEQETLKSKGA